MRVAACHKMKPEALNRYNVESFDFLVVPDAVNGIKNDDGTNGFVIYTDKVYVAALTGKFISEHDFSITSIYVKPEYRRKGVGAFMMKTLYDILEDYNAQISVEFALSGNGGDGLSEFFIKEGFSEYYNEDSSVYALDVASLMRAKIPAAKKTDNVVPFSKIPEKVFRGFKPDESEFVPLPRGGFGAPSIERSLSMGLVEDETLKAYAIVEKYDDSSLGLNCVYVKPASSERVFVNLVSKMIEEVQKYYDTDTCVYIPAVNERIRSALEKVFTEAKLSAGTVTYKKAPEYSEYNYSEISLSDFLEAEGVLE